MVVRWAVAAKPTPPCCGESDADRSLHPLRHQHLRVARHALREPLVGSVGSPPFTVPGPSVGFFFKKKKENMKETAVSWNAANWSRDLQQCLLDLETARTLKLVTALAPGLDVNRRNNNYRLGPCDGCGSSTVSRQAWDGPKRSAPKQDRGRQPAGTHVRHVGQACRQVGPGRVDKGSGQGDSILAGVWFGRCRRSSAITSADCSPGPKGQRSEFDAHDLCGGSVFQSRLWTS